MHLEGHVDLTGFTQAVDARPKFGILYLVGIPYMCPLFLPAYLSAKDFLQGTVRAIARRSYDYRFVFLWVVILTFGFMLRAQGEHRRMTAVYPALAVLAGCYYEKFIFYSGKLSKFLGNSLFREIVVITVMLACAVLWSVPMGMDGAFKNMTLMRKPF